MRWTEQEYQAHLARIRAPLNPFNPEDPDTPDQGPESTLQGKITAWAKERAFPCLSFRQSKKAKGFLTPGTPDIILALPKGQVLWLELKSSKGSLREDQKLMAQELLYLKHKWHCLKSYRKFLDIVGKLQ